MGALLLLLGCLSVARVTAAALYRSSGERAVATEPTTALRRASTSLELNDEALPAYYLKAAALERLGRIGEARAVLLEAARREPHDFVPWGLLGHLSARTGDLERARRSYLSASRLNPRDPALAQLARDPARSQPP